MSARPRPRRDLALEDAPRQAPRWSAGEDPADAELRAVAGLPEERDVVLGVAGDHALGDELELELVAERIYGHWPAKHASYDAALEEARRQLNRRT